jgi:predicted nuclease with TOPRIM domain
LNYEEEIARAQEQIKTLFQNQASLEKRWGEIIEKLDCLQKQLNNRLPLWATALIALLTSMLAWFAKGG